MAGMKAFEVFGEILMKGKAQAEADIKGFTKAGEDSGKSLNLSMAAAGGAMLVAGVAVEKAMGTATTAAKDYGSQVVLLQRMTGASAEESSKFAAILGRYGVEGPKAALVMKSLNNAIATHSEKLASIGVATQNADGTNRTHMQVLGDLAEKYKNAKDKTEVLAVGTATLGRGFSALLPVLANGKAGIEALGKAAQENGLILSEADLKAVKDYSKALADNKDAMKGVEVQVGLATLPFETFKTKALGQTLKSLRDFNPEFQKTAGAVGSIAGPALKATGQVLLLAVGIKMLGIGSYIATGGLAGLAGGLAVANAYLQKNAAEKSAEGFTKLAASIGIVGPQVKVVGRALEILRQGPMGLASFGITTSIDKFKTALGLAKGKVETTNPVLDALEQAQSDVAAATEEVSKANDTLVRSMDGVLRKADDLSARQRTAAEADLAVQTATLDLMDARKESATALKEHGAKSEEYARAQIAVRDAEFKLKDATADSNTAVGDLNKTLGEVPSDVTTKVNADTANANMQVKTFKNHVDTAAMPKTVTLTAKTSGMSALSSLKTMWDKLVNKTITLTTKTIGGGGGGGGGGGANAFGGLYRTPTNILVGETYEPEYVINGAKLASGDSRQIELLGGLLQTAGLTGASAQQPVMQVFVDLGDGMRRVNTTQVKSGNYRAVLAGR